MGNNLQDVTTNYLSQDISHPTYLARRLNGLAEGSAGRFARECVAYKLIFRRMHYERTVFHILTDAQETEISNATFGYQASIVLQMKIEISFGEINLFQIN